MQKGPDSCLCVTKMNFLFLCFVFVGLLQKSDTASLTSYITNHTRRHIYIIQGVLCPEGLKQLPYHNYYELDRSVNGYLLPESKSMRENTHTHIHQNKKHASVNSGESYT